MKGSRALLQMLEDRGVETMFGYPGGAVIPIYDEIRDSSIRHILARHEQCAAHMADGYARASGRTGVCLSTSGPGATNMVTGIATAYADSVPMLALTGQVGTEVMGAEAFQEVDAYSLFMSVTKHNFRVLDVNRLPHAISEAWDIARSGRPGPVHIDLPVDQMNAQIDGSLLRKSYGIKEPTEDVSSLPDAIKLIKESKKPVLMAGGGVISAGASEELVRLAEMIDAPVVTPMMGIGSIPTRHPLNMGSLGMHGRVCALEAFQNADLIIAVGTKFSDRTYSPHTAPGKGCRVVQIDLDATQFGKSGRESINLQCDAKRALNLLIDGIGGRSAHASWIRQAKEWREERAVSFDYYTYPIIPQKIMWDLNRLIDDDTIITTDVGQNQMWAMHFLDINRPRQFISSGSFGTMGFGLPAAIGAKASRPDCKVAAIVGDGGLQMVIQELATSVAEDLPVVVILLNNGWLGMVRQWQKLFWNRRYSQTELKDDPDFTMIAKAYRADGVTVDRAGDVYDALKAALDSDRTTVVDIRVDPEEDVLPMLPPDPRLDIIEGRCKY
ncbi:biosynthetic-type acetolactate synthase large subunit [Methanomassiliicoccaceae archaeon COG_1]|nr:biosynthetic-type acetolactate synthase large subunit [Methanomassiliicoccaceae archaeon COG_1]